jgi:hypothetical protein
MITAKEREEAFLADLQDVFNEHRAYFEYETSGFYSEEAFIALESLWEEDVLLGESAYFEFPKYFMCD